MIQQSHQPRDDEYIAATVEYTSWLRKRWMMNPNQVDLRPLHRIWWLIDLQSRDDDEDPLTAAQLKPLVYEQLRTLYLIGVSDLGMDRKAEMMYRHTYGRDCGDASTEKSQLQYLQQGAYWRGVKRLEKLAERLEADEDSVARAEVQKQLADWHLWYGHYRRAADHYRESWQLLTGEDVTELRQQWYGAPLELPADGVLWPGPRAKGPMEETVLVRAQFSVSAKGKPRDIDTRALDLEREGMAYRVRRWLRDARFRPRLEGGEMVATERVEREYRVN